MTRRRFRLALFPVAVAAEFCYLAGDVLTFVVRRHQ